MDNNENKCKPLESNLIKEYQTEDDIVDNH